MNTFRKIGCLLLIAAFSFPCFAKKRIHLKGKWSDRFRTIISEQSIQAWVEDNNKDLLLEFSANLGTVEVTITNSVGEVVYKQSVHLNLSINYLRIPIVRIVHILMQNSGFYHPF